MILVHLKEVIILPSGSIYCAVRGKKNGKIVSTKLLPLMHCKKVSCFLRIGLICLEKYPKLKGNFYLCPKQVGYCILLTQNQNVFILFARTPLN